ncbi:hypothetical protein FSARC_10108 [Fusarium sarcochroum]|uniref:Calpain catalytic domain-containing protein n=1 Tax=Fusarium sarcochroum TaxID=1208366 RepID=A0A8H4TPM3_9HYPO|nr:hypothetical protein FSARC_10108 [Fusarium sarcochroum]
MYGYSSSEESDDPRRPHAQPATDNNSDQKKKKKKKLPPQEFINHIWKKFSKHKFHKALAVLPFDPVQPPSTIHSNELLSAGYERAAEDCRRKVNKIIGECKRVNLRYRDPDWDLDLDLRWQKGLCLNTIGKTMFELSKETLLNPQASVPKAVKRVHEIFEKPTFMEDISGSDVKQGHLGDCWMISGLTALANVPDDLRRICVARDTKIGIYGFVFYRDGEWIYSIIDDKLYLTSPCWDSHSTHRELLQQIDREDAENVYRQTYQTGSKALFFAQCRNQNETWAPLFEKAYAKAHGDYASLDGGWTGEGIEDLSGGVTTELLTSDILDIDEFWNKEMSRVNDEFLFGASTGHLEHGYGERDGISEGHAYVVLKVHTLKSGQRLVKLRNPWGTVRQGIWKGAWSDGSKEWTAEVQQEMDHEFGSDSVFWIAYEDLVRKYSHLDRTRLLRDHDWRCCQQWIAVDVPWEASYHEKFHIKLTEDSSLILVLSQLDGRYFKGFEGQYLFRLQFRLHCKGNPSAEDYIVRSHGNYFMDRSVSMELPDLPSGDYVVYLKVVGEMDSSLQSVEQVVKRETSKRIENEKLAQVGRAYDLAHSKAWDHMDKVAKLRQKKDQQKASGCRQWERRKRWQKRSTNRDVTEKQTRKNLEKRQSRRVEWEAEQTRFDQEFNDKVKAEREQKKKSRLIKTEGEKAAEAEEKAEDADDEALSRNTEVMKLSADDKSETVVVDEHHEDRDVAVMSCSTESSHSTPETIKSTVMIAEKQEVLSVSRSPPPPVDEEEPLPVRPRPAYNSADESSDSPVEEWEALYSSDDLTRDPQSPQVNQAVAQDEYDSEEEKMPEPWNAICIVGVRVYSKDENLELRTVMEGGELLEEGIEPKGLADLDNAQSNAGGSRA